MKPAHLIRAAWDGFSRFWSSSTTVVLGARQAGVYVDHDRALTHATVWACVRIISETIAGLPWGVYAKQGKKRIAQPENPVDWLLSVQANPETTAFLAIETILRDALLKGNGYWEIERDMGGRPLWLWRLDPDRTEPWRDPETGALVYRHRPADGGAYTYIPAQDVFHLRGPTLDGVTGISVVSFAALTFGLGIALERFGASFFGNGTVAGTVLQTDQKLSAKDIEDLRDAWEQGRKGPQNAHKPAVLHGGLKVAQTIIPPDDAQFLDSRKHQVRDICRWFGVPPHKVADLENMTLTNIEQMSIEFVTGCLMPWIRRLETEAQVKLLGRNNRARLYTRISVDALLRGDFKSRSEGYTQALRSGWLSIDDVRELEDMNPVGKGGDLYLVQSQMVPIDTIRETVEAANKRASQPPSAPPMAPEDDPEDDGADPPAPAARPHLHPVRAGNGQ